FRRDGQMLASASLDRTVKLWDVSADGSLSLNSILPLDLSAVQDLSFNTDGSQLALAEKGLVRFWELKRQQERQPLFVQDGLVKTITFDRTGTLLATGGSDGLVRVWDVRSGACVETFSGHSAAVNRIKFSPDSEVLASSSEDATVRVWGVSGLLAASAGENE